MSEEKKLHACLDLFRRLPPSQVETNLDFISQLCPDIEEQILQSVDVPLHIVKDVSVGKDFLVCEYNRDGDQYRSPFSNKYFPEEEVEEAGQLPPDHLRKLEIEANAVFQIYTQLYYDNALCSVYFWEVNEDSFAACVLIKKDDSGNGGTEKGIWDSLHVIEVTPSDKTATYKLTTTIILQLKTQDGLELSGQIQRQTKLENAPLDKTRTHVTNMGNMIQTMENKLRDDLQSIYFDKAREVTSALRSTVGVEQRNKQKMYLTDLKAALNPRR